MNDQPIILHVEDTPEQQQLIRLLLEPICTLYQAATLNEASRLIDQHVFDLVLLDMQLSDGSGLDLIPQIKERAASTRIALHTADEYSDMRVKVDGIISKTDTPIAALPDQVLSILQA